METEGDFIIIYPKFIRKNGKIIYPKNGKCFKIKIPKDKYKAS